MGPFKSISDKKDCSTWGSPVYGSCRIGLEKQFPTPTHRSQTEAVPAVMPPEAGMCKFSFVLAERLWDNDVDQDTILKRGWHTFISVKGKELFACSGSCTRSMRSEGKQQVCINT